MSTVITFEATIAEGNATPVTDGIIEILSIISDMEPSFREWRDETDISWSTARQTDIGTISAQIQPHREDVSPNDRH